MTGPTHIVVGMSLGVVIARLNILELTAPALVFLCIGALTPDLDGDGSISRPGTILSRFLPKGLRKMLDGIGQTISGIANLLTGHRGFFHWLMVPILFLIWACYLENLYFMWFALGYFSHVLADACTVAGVPLFAPLNRKNISFAPVRTGSTIEVVLFVLFLMIVVYFGWSLLPDLTRNAIASFLELLSD